MPGDFILAWMPGDWMTGDWQGMPGHFIHAWMPGDWCLVKLTMNDR